MRAPLMKPVALELQGIDSPLGVPTVIIPSPTDSNFTLFFLLQTAKAILPRSSLR